MNRWKNSFLYFQKYFANNHIWCISGVYIPLVVAEVICGDEAIEAGGGGIPRYLQTHVVLQSFYLLPSDHDRDPGIQLQNEWKKELIKVLLDSEEYTVSTDICNGILSSSITFITGNICWTITTGN